MFCSHSQSGNTNSKTPQICSLLFVSAALNALHITTTSCTTEIISHLVSLLPLLSPSQQPPERSFSKSIPGSWLLIKFRQKKKSKLLPFSQGRVWLLSSHPCLYCKLASLFFLWPAKLQAASALDKLPPELCIACYSILFSPLLKNQPLRGPPDCLICNGPVPQLFYFSTHYLYFHGKHHHSVKLSYLLICRRRNIVFFSLMYLSSNARYNISTQ